MTVEQIKELIKTEKYDFLRTNPHLGDNICLLTLGGSHAYGMNTDSSDVDIRGFATLTKEDILLGRDFEQVEDRATDTVVYSLDKGVRLLRGQNPNMLEILFVRPEHIIYANEAGCRLLGIRDCFLTKNIIKKCGGYANEQLNRLENAARQELTPEKVEEHILRSITNAKYRLFDNDVLSEGDSIDFYLGDTDSGGKTKEIFVDASLKHCTLRGFIGMQNTLRGVVRDYDKMGKRCSSAVNRNKIPKHAAHLVRLLTLAEKALRTGEFTTYMEQEHDLLMSIRNGEYGGKDGKPMSPEFYGMVAELDAKMRDAYETSCLPDSVDDKAINKAMYEINSAVVSRKSRR